MVNALGGILSLNSKDLTITDRKIANILVNLSFANTAGTNPSNQCKEGQPNFFAIQNKKNLSTAKVVFFNKVSIYFKKKNI